ncbi:MAG TPA: GMC family oxidoreductase N-terminal domain-containing protein, partial [Acetobacteraceae bacterium]|nr:GMC family oxidoreductase N-terminal domain-containing protein [Acetobacteraceae bacterium]
MAGGSGFDYIIVGGGSAGCLAASRLVRDHRARVLLIEAGGPDRSPLFRMPAGFIRFLKGSPHLTFHKLAPQPQLGGRVIEVPQARVLGGGSTINGMVYMRGQPADYDEWAETTGDPGWGYRHLLPHFTRMEGNQRLNNAFHGVNGPLKVSDHVSRCAISDAFVAAVQGTGLPFRHDFNGTRQTGVGYMQLTTLRGERCSAVRAFLTPVMNDPGLTIATGCLVTRILFEGLRAVGVEYATAAGQTVSARAESEVVLAAGAYATPKLLMLNGIGPAAQLARHGIGVRVDLPGVGENLQDHHEVPIFAATTGHYGYYGEDRGWRLLRNGLQYLLFRTGPVTSNGVEACAFFNPDSAEQDARLKLYCVPTIYLDRGMTAVQPTDGLTLNACLLRPKARGTVSLASADPRALPVIDPRYLTDPEDVRLSVAGLRFAREVLAQDPLRALVRGEIHPGTAVASDDALAAHCRAMVKTNYHPVGTCRMGRDDDPMAVLTPEMRVRGVEGLRVLDASAMPNVVSGNTNAPVMAMADRGVAL